MILGWKIVNRCSAVIYGVKTKESLMEELGYE